MREHPIQGGRKFHAGIDLAAPTGTPTRTVQGGRIVYTGDVSGYGMTVVVETATGHLEQFAHLSEIDVGLDEVLQPGAVVGKVGSTGNSSGPHLDFVVYRPGTGDNFLRGNYPEVTMNPLDYLSQVQQVEVIPLGHGAAPQAADYIPDPNLSPLDNVIASYNRFSGTISVGNYHQNPATTFTPASPQQTARPSINRADYMVGGQIRNDPANNYGYQQVANDRDYRIRLAEVSSALNIPAQWLADVIDFETIGTHDAGIVNPLGCVGLIQFCPGGGMADLAQEWGVSVSQASSRLQGMTPAQQLDWVHYYLNRYSNSGAELHTIEDLYALINGGPGGLAQSVEGRRGINDYFDGGGGTLVSHFNRLGNRAGRQYATSYRTFETSYHTSPVPGCHECNRQANAFGQVFPHEAP
jgi:hypothetical protein